MIKYRTWWVIVLGYALLATLYTSLAALSTPNLQAILQEHTPGILYAHLILILFTLLLDFGAVNRMRRRNPVAVRWMLLTFMVGGTLLTALLAPQTHRIFYDEDIYQGIAMNMAFENRAQMCNEGVQEHGIFHCQRGEYNKQPNGFPFLVAMAFRLAGVHEQAAFHLNNLLFGVALVTVFFIARHLFYSLWAGYFAALITALIPQNLHWFNTTSAEPAAAVSAALVVLAGLRATRHRSDESLLLLVVLTSFCLHMRPENALILVVVPAIFLLGWPGIVRESRFYLFAGMFALLAAPAFMHARLVRHNPWGSGSAPFATQYFNGNLEVNLPYYFNNLQFPALFTLLALAGWFCIRSWRAWLLLWLWFLLFWGIFLFFYAGRYDYGADIRFSIPSHLPLALLAGGATRWLGQVLARKSRRPVRQWYAIMTVFLVLAFVPFLPRVRAVTSEAWAARADHQFAREMAATLPASTIILTHNPNMFHLWGKNAAQASIALEEPGHTLNYYFSRYRDGVYFHYNFWCNVADPLQNSFCTRLLERNRHELIMEYREWNYRYALYRLLPPS
ncbi:MAG: glycosyltransferase family 39 protein [Magnetococcales bacterium]|nr:glycosyltransferase family 39 protein [Magnetococcales bacterium]MBF0150109.1 glycosyltransferase family 39 protein [Magnetococcales bacterium]MBF0631241.1 glycosyltransferase family 39 protein [Magnetococcales bacterium]